MTQTIHKTVFVLDHGPSMGEPSKQTIDLDIFMKSRPQGMIPLPPVSKSIWTCCMEALCEYCRIVWDIFPKQKFLRFVVSDVSSRTLNTWSSKEQSNGFLLQSLSTVGPPIQRPESSILHGLDDAIKSLCEPTTLQKSGTDDSKSSLNGASNKGRIICITQLKHDNQMKSIESFVAESVKKHNELSSKPNSGLLPINELELSIVHVKPFGADLQVTEKPRTALNEAPFIKSVVYNVKCTRHGIAIANRLLSLVQIHYNLSVTSVSGIPMKEEQHANSSANYDVLLLHPQLPGMHNVMTGSSLTPCDAELSSTMMLKWNTPKINANEFFLCNAAQRVSPVDVNSRPSLCLTNFLLSGRSVLLEMWQNGQNVGNGGSRQTTHMISCHGNDIFLHALNTTKMPFDDPPSITEGVGGKVTDYRIADLSNFMKEAHLHPYGHAKKKIDLSSPLPLERMKTKIEKLSRHWPLVFSQTVIYSLQDKIDPLLSLMLQDSITEYDVVNCKSVIYHIIEMERTNTPLPSSFSGTRSKANKRDEQYKTLWAEMEKFLCAYSTLSEQHDEVYQCMLQCIGKTDSRPESKRKAETVFESPESPPPMKKIKTEDIMIIRPTQKGAQNLYDMWWNRIENIHQQRHVEFYGRLTSEGNVARLYPHLELANPPEQQGNERSGRHSGRGTFQQNSRSSTPSGRSTPTGRSTPNGRSTPIGTSGKSGKMKRDKLGKNY